MAHLVKYLPWKVRTWVQFPEHTWKKPGQAVCTCNHRAPRIDNWMPGAYCSASTAFSMSSRSVRNTVSRCLAPEEEPRLRLFSVLHTRTDLPTRAPGHEYMHTFTRTHPHTHKIFKEFKMQSSLLWASSDDLGSRNTAALHQRRVEGRPLWAAFYPRRMDHFIRFITFHKTAGRFILFSLSHLWNHFGPIIVSYLICFFID